MGRVSFSTVYGSVVIEVPLIGVGSCPTAGGVGKLNYTTHISCRYIGAEISN